MRSASCWNVDAGRAAAARTRRDARRERSQPQGLEKLTSGVHLFAPIAAGSRRERDANGVADPFGQQHGHRCRRPHQAFDAHARFGEPEVQRLIGRSRERPVDGDEIARTGRLARDDDLIAAQTAVDGQRRRFDRRENHAVVDDLLRRLAEIAIGVFLHPCDDELLVERSAVDADTHRLSTIHGHLADGGELLVTPPAGADIARVDTVLVERARRTRDTW